VEVEVDSAEKVVEVDSADSVLEVDSVKKEEDLAEEVTA
jgi:hypothetical protein